MRILVCDKCGSDKNVNIYTVNDNPLTVYNLGLLPVYYTANGVHKSKLMELCSNCKRLVDDKYDEFLKFLSTKEENPAV